jgi:DNA anti-recombination protein RmuC
MSLALIISFLKKHWLPIVLVLVGVVIVFRYKQRDGEFAAVLKTTQDADATAMKKAQAAWSKEEAQHAKDISDLQKSLEQVQQAYTAQTQAIEARRKAKVAALTKQYSADPDEMTKQLSDALGFRVVSGATK